MADRNETIQAIRNALKARSGKDWSVKGGKGTAWGWIKITVPPRRLGCAEYHDFQAPDDVCVDCGEYRGMSDACPAHACADDCYRAYITPADRAELAALLGLERVHSQGVSIGASSAYYTEYVARAAGIERPAVVGVPYWD